jgi:NADH:ubiquinone reductase (H+-translocating)
MQNRKHIVVVGAGFGGLKTVRKLCRHPVEITLVDKTNHHLFQPLLYQVATSALAPGDIAIPARAIFKRRNNVHVLMGEVTRVDTAGKQIHLENGQTVAYDYLVLAPGTSHSYFGNDNWEEHAPGLKTLSDALDIRERILLAYEKAERETDPAKRKRHETFVVVGGGPTGVELAGTLAEISTKTMSEDYENVDLDLLEIILVEGQPCILNTYHASLGEKAVRDLEKLGVKVMRNSMVTDIEQAGVHIRVSDADGNDTQELFIETDTVIWAAGNAASPLLETLDIPLEKDGRVCVDPDLSVPGHPEVFVIGDAARQINPNGKETPAMAPGALQHGEYVARTIVADLNGKERRPFEYFDKGSMATIGRARAIAQIRNWRFSGFFAWLLWSLVHILFLIGYRNRFRVMAEWFWFYITFRGGSRLITRSQMSPHALHTDQE